MTEDDVVARLEDGMTVGLGGWGSRRKPMSIVRAILRSDLKDLRLVSYGGPDVGMLCAAGKVRELVFAFVSLDVIPLEPYFRRARESGAIAARELDEGMMLLGLQAAAWRVPFLPTRVGLGSDLFRIDPTLRTVVSPYPGPDGTPEELVAVPALELDAAIVHVHRADRRGNGRLLDDDPYFDTLFLGAARDRYLTCEELVEPADLLGDGDFRTLAVPRYLVDGVVAAPGGSHPTSCDPLHPRDVGHLREYAGSAATPEGWAGYAQRWLDGDEADYQRRVGGAA
ncbi:CoA transferase subunit A [Spongisporangium articulatum]|uniref:CoA transferase subunit A n=1 Tax=Spongisporangium articulatum TaxID=3362603 RepID=A0ABW8AVY9_9ACTN